MKNKKLASFLSVLLITSMLVTGCNSTQTTTTESSSVATTTTAESNTEVISTAYLSTDSEIAVDTEFTASDLDVGYEDTTATHITLNSSSISVSGEGATASGTVLTISEAGTYVISGTLTDGQIVVETADSDKVHIVLNGVNIHCSDSAAIYIKSADKVFLTLQKDTENTLTDGSEYVQTDDNTVDAVIFSKSDLTINGEGSLNITATYQSGIVSKDDLVITGGTFQITAVKDALNGKDSVKIKDGTFTLDASTGNGIQSKNSDDSTKGYVYICGGTITITNSNEGIEGTAIVIDDGVIVINATDDGMNAANGVSSTTETTDNTSTTTPGGGMQGGGTFENDTNCYISISGGSVTVNASSDGIDSNGSLYISGGTLYVSGPTNSGNGAMDYNGSAEITGGTVVIAGSSGMAQGFSETSTQYSLLYNFDSVCAAGTEITLTDASGNVVATYTPDKEFQSVVISTSSLTKNATYNLTAGDQTAEITLSSIVTSNAQAGVGGPGMGNPGTGGKGSGGPRGQAPTGTLPSDSSTTDTTTATDSTTTADSL